MQTNETWACEGSREGLGGAGRVRGSGLLELDSEG